MRQVCGTVTDIGLKGPDITGELDICLRMLVYPITNVWMRIHHIMMYKESGDIYDNPSSENERGLIWMQ